MPSKKYQDRGIWIYTGTSGRLKEIRDAAKKRGLQPSKYLMAAEEAYRMSDSRLHIGPDLDLQRRENHRLATDLHGKDLIIAQQEAELRKLRGTPFLQPSWDADIDSDLLKMLRNGPIHTHKLLAELEANEAEAVRGVSKQLQILEVLGFISKSSHGWCWEK